MLETERLILKKGILSDAKKYHQNFWSQEDTAKFMLWSVTKRVEDSVNKLKSWIEYQKDHDQWFIYEKTTNKPIGFISVVDLGDGKWGDIGLCIGQDFKGKGYGTEVMRFVLDYVKAKGGKQIEYSHIEGNLPSQKLAEKFGFKFINKTKRLRKRDNAELCELVYILDL